MKRFLLLMLIMSALTMSCSNKGETSKVDGDNPFFKEFDTPFGLPDFAAIKLEHYLPAVNEGLKRQNAEIDAIIATKEAPNFENTILAFDNSGLLLENVTSVFFNLLQADKQEGMQELAEQITSLVAEHTDKIAMNEKLFARVKAVYDQREKLNLNAEQRMVVEKFYQDFVRGGANLNAEDKKSLMAINQELSKLTLKFGDNILSNTNAFEMVLDKEEDLVGLPQSVRDAAAEAANEKGYKGKWLFTVHKPSLIPFLTYSERRDLREKMLNAYTTRGNHNDSLDNKAIAKTIINLRIKKANLLGFDSYGAYVLDENMAKNPANVKKLLDEVWLAALPVAKAELAEMQKVATKEGAKFQLQAWDWWFYAEKLRKQKYDLDEEQLRPYFQLDSVLGGVFTVSNKLYGLNFTQLKEVPTYNKDARVYEVKEADGKHVGILYMDFFPRESKGSGAWMTEIRKQSRRNGKETSPVIMVVCNFSAPTANTPALLNLDEVETLFHEFGHALHGLLSNSTYGRISSTNVARDFVELPSQIMENWCTEPEVMKMYAKHYKTGEVIPDALIAKMQKSSYFNMGFTTVEFVAAALLDYSWHTLTAPFEGDVMEFENNSMKAIGLIPEIVVRYRTPYFSHIFDGGYAMGYYGYVWAEVLDADAFQAFKETSLFDQKTATSFRKNILERGGSENPMKLYVQFRGKEPNTKPLLMRRGFIKK